MTVSPLVEVLGENFAKYMEALKPSLIIGLENVAEHQVTIIVKHFICLVIRMLVSYNY